MRYMDIYNVIGTDEWGDQAVVATLQAEGYNSYTKAYEQAEELGFPIGQFLGGIGTRYRLEKATSVRLP